MNLDLTDLLTLVTAVGAGLVGGAFYAFSSFVMPALGRLPGEQGVAAMQGINLAAPRPAFMLSFIGTAVLSAGLLVVSVVEWGDSGTGWQIAGSLLYLGCFVLTVVYHVPRNEALGRLDPGDPATSGRWVEYQHGWNRWNHVRGALAVAALVVLVLALAER